MWDDRRQSWKTIYPVGKGKSLKGFKKINDPSCFWKHGKGRMDSLLLHRRVKPTPCVPHIWQTPMESQGRQCRRFWLMPDTTEATVRRGRLNSLRSLSQLKNTWALVASQKFRSCPTWKKKPDGMRSGFSLSCSNRTLLVIKILKYFSTSRKIATSLRGFSSLPWDYPNPTSHDSALNSVQPSRKPQNQLQCTLAVLVSEIFTVTHWLLNILNILPTGGQAQRAPFNC